jgi:hypothetical protein
MAVMTTSLTEFSDRENARTYTYTGHSVQLPKLVLHKRRVPQSAGDLATQQVSVVNGVSNSSAVALEKKAAIEANIRYPSDAAAADLAALLATFRDIVRSDEFGVAFTTQNYLK